MTAYVLFTKIKYLIIIFIVNDLYFSSIEFNSVYLLFTSELLLLLIIETNFMKIKHQSVYKMVYKIDSGNIVLGM